MSSNVSNIALDSVAAQVTEFGSRAAGAVTQRDSSSPGIPERSRRNRINRATVDSKMLNDFEWPLAVLCNFVQITVKLAL